MSGSERPEIHLFQKLDQEASDAEKENSEVTSVLAVVLGNRGVKLQLGCKQRNRIQQAKALAVPLRLDRRLLCAGRSPGDPAHHFDVGGDAANPKRDGTCQRGHFPPIRKHRG